jgi:transcription-repair coupling factor (superfamily II helicase)
MGSNLRVAPADLPESLQVRLKRMYPNAKHFAQTNSVSVPMPVIDGRPLADAELIEWVANLIEAIFAPAVPAKPEPESTTASR